MRNSYRILVGVLALFALVAQVQAKSVTNRGETFTVNTLTDDGPLGSSTRVEDISKVPTQQDRLGVYIASYDFSTDGGAVSSIDLSIEDVPKGMILLENAVVEVYEAVAPAGAQTALAVGGVTVLTAGTTLGSTGIKQVVTTPGITTADDKIALTISGSVATAGKFTVYLPVVLGNQQ